MNDAAPEGIRPAAVTAWLVDCVPDFTPPVQFTLIAGGHSNLTFSCTDRDGRRCVLRRPPLGHVLESAHDMGREHRVISALADSGVPVAPTFGLCPDTSVNDAPFFVMAFVDGVVPHNRAAVASLSSADRERLAWHTVDTLAALHAIDPKAVGLDDLGRHEAYIARQLKRWTRQWEASITHDVPAMEQSRALLESEMPEQVGYTIVHGDYRLGNFITADGVIRAVCDWELCTLGDPLADVAYLVNTWASPGAAITGVDDEMPTMAGNFPTREALVERYAARSGRDCTAINYYRAFSYWRIAAIRQGVYKRYLEGAMGQREDVDLDLFRRGVERCAAAALALLTS